MVEPAKRDTILVVDDEALNIRVLTGVLTRGGYEVRCASNGPEALALAKAQRPDMILLDVMMPGETGLETCRKLKADPDTSRIPVIFVTCLGETADKLAGLDLGAVDYITKPFNAEEVLARVRTHLNFTQAQGAIINAQAQRLGQVRTAQQALLPSPHSLPEARFAAHYVPVLEAGGDFYDVLSFGNGLTVYFVADVSGHDLGASFITSSLKALFWQHASANGSPGGTLEAMNRILCSITSEEVYLTAACLMLDRANGVYRVSSAGHPPVLAQLGGQERSVEVPGLPMGMFEGAEFGEEQGRMLPGDRFFLYTDGLAEASGQYVTSEDFRSRLAMACRHNAQLPLDRAVQAMASELLGGHNTADDVVLLGVEA